MPPAPITDALDQFAGEPVSIVGCPDEHLFADAAALMVEHCEQRKDRFAILQSPQPAIPTATHEPPVHSSYSAYYHPWPVVAPLRPAEFVALRFIYQRDKPPA